MVNCAGVLQDGPNESTSAVHYLGIAHLFSACEILGIRRVIHFSAVGVDRQRPTPFSQTKLAGDNVLMERDLDWVVLRPSVVIGRPAYGASALMRGLAALPLVPVMPDTGPIQIVLLDDVVRTVEHFLTEGTPSREIVELVGPCRYSFAEVIALFRRWYRWRPARQIHLPRLITGLLYRSGETISFARSRSTARTTGERTIGQKPIPAAAFIPCATPSPTRGASSAACSPPAARCNTCATCC